MSKFEYYLEMAYRGGESYSGRSLLTDSAVGQWIYRNRLTRNDFTFMRQRTDFSKDLPEGELRIFANVSKSDPTLKKRLTSLFTEKAPELIEGGSDLKGDSPWEIVYGWLRLRHQPWGDELEEKRAKKQAEQIKNILTAANMKFEYNSEYYSFSFPSAITFIKHRIEWKPKGATKWETLTAPKKVFQDEEYAQFLDQCYKAKNVSELPSELKTQISGLKVVK